MIETKRMRFREAAAEDIDQIIALEEHKDNRKFVWIGTRTEHQNEIEDPNHILLIFEKKEDESTAGGRKEDETKADSCQKGSGAGDTVGYALIRLNPQSEIFELRRIVISEKNQGYGREAMEALFKYAFEDLHINRFWLDAYPDNAVGIHLYESLGRHRDGVLRQNYKSERGYLDQIIFSMLKDEYFKRQK